MTALTVNQVFLLGWMVGAIHKAELERDPFTIGRFNDCIQAGEIGDSAWETLEHLITAGLVESRFYGPPEGQPSAARLLSISPAGWARIGEIRAAR
jgi:hypothetical protein